ncbi:hypothetical protein KZX47_08915 [Thermus sp. SYSU G05001]|uniref:Uncharacterized protein n=1 Tax=Thermus brevis TaxID=2862456 RepID=A0ABS7A0M2_9DEIN|nr:hypothetical protein [Thermus brevis]MBW6395267.1 hypothetical protein [Thermus brevis]
MVAQTPLAVRDPVAHARWLWEGYRELLAPEEEYEPLTLLGAVEEWPVFVRALKRAASQDAAEALRLAEAVWEEQAALRALGVRLPPSKEAFLAQLGVG